MAGFCTKCGAALAEGLQFCTACGSPVTGGRATGTPGPAAPPPSAAPPPQGGGTSGVKILLIVLGVFAVIAVLCAAAVGFGLYTFTRNVKVEEGGRQVSVSTPGGTVKLGEIDKVSEEQLGIRIYPGAEQQSGGMTVETPEGMSGTYVFRTKDSPRDVLDFYRDALGERGPSVVYSNDGGIVTTTKEGSKDHYMITVGRDDGEGYTNIAIIHSHKD